MHARPGGGAVGPILALSRSSNPRETAVWLKPLENLREAWKFIHRRRTWLLGGGLGSTGVRTSKDGTSCGEGSP